MTNSQHFAQAVAFGDRLIETGDLDPVYIALHEAQLNFSVRSRVLLAYTCLYHLGAAAAIAASSDFWLHLQIAARNPKLAWPRGSERRHWRGDNAMATWEYLAEHYKKPEDVVDYWMSGSLSFRAVSERVREIPGFGPWIAFKVADLLERVMEMPVNFDDCELGVYSEPRKGAALLFHGDVEHSITDANLHELVTTMLREPKLRRHKAPPADDRRINIQEIETVLCKYKAHVNGHYPLGKDTHEVVHALSSRPWGRVAQKLLAAVKPLERYWR
jgi:hypothetical protein